MNPEKIGLLIAALRKEKHMTQRAVAAALQVSEKTISKWETGRGCPDVSLLPGLAAVLGVPADRLLSGELSPNEKDGGNMKRVQFYVCPGCGNILTATGKGEIVCCGRRLEPLCPSAPDADHRPEISLVETDDYITFSHPMRKDHYLKFAAYVTCDRLALTRLYPEQEAAVRFPRMGGGTLYFYCVKHGLMQQKL